MTRYKTGIVIAVMAYVLAWFLPVVSGGHYGWEAFRVALSPIWPYEGAQADNAFRAFLNVASAFTNVLFVVETGLLWLWPARIARVAMWTLIVAALLDTQWFVLGDRSDIRDLRVGYYLWVGAFFLLAFSAYLGGSKASAGRPLRAAV